MSDLGAFTPATITPKFTITPPPPSTKPTSPDGVVKRGPGRPPGRKNNPKPPELGVNPSMEVGLGGRPKTTASTPVDTEANKKAEKKARADEYARYISEEVNDKIFMAIVMLSGGKVKPEAFYLPGKAPESKQSDSRLSDLGNTVAIPPDMARSWGKLLAELSYTDAGKSATKFAGNNNLAIIGAALTAGLTTLQYAFSIKPIVDGMKQLAQQQVVEEEQT